jgi:hypothetical protein
MVKSNDPARDDLPRIELRVTGAWQSPAELWDQFEDGKLGYRLDENDLIHVSTGARFGLGTSPHDDDIAQIFEGTGRLSDEEIDRIARHTVKIHISGLGGSPDNARAIMQAAAALIRAGGSGVFIDNSGNAHGRDDWLKLAGDTQPGGAYWAFVAVTASEEEVFSVGMHCLGFRDAEMPDPPGREQGGFMIHNFLGYTYQSGATINDGEAIGGPEGASHRVRAIECTRFPADTPWYNPYGIWQLEWIDDDDD